MMKELLLNNAFCNGDVNAIEISLAPFFSLSPALLSSLFVDALQTEGVLENESARLLSKILLSQTPKRPKLARNLPHSS